MVISKTSVKTRKENPYIETVGRRKTSVARIRITPATRDSITVNGHDFESYFPTLALRSTVFDPFAKSKITQKFKTMAVVSGGGISAQATAVRHGLTRALVEVHPELRKKMKRLGYLMRDPREKERRKFGLKKARKSPQWSKR